MSDFNALKFVADNAGLNIFKALEKAYEHGKADANCPEIPDSCNVETVEAIPTAWIEAEIKKLRDMDNGFASLSAGQIEAMLKKWRKRGEADGQK